MTDSGRSHTHPRSTAKIGGHPIHPMLVPFPIVCFIGAFVTDIVYNSNNDQGWATASFWLLGIGLVMAALAAVAGLTDFLGDDRVRGLGDAVKHMLANVTAVVILKFAVKALKRKLPSIPLNYENWIAGLDQGHKRSTHVSQSLNTSERKKIKTVSRR